MFTLGIVKPIYIIGIGIESFYISHVVPKIYYLGNYPTKPLLHPEGDFHLDVDIHLSFIEGKSYNLISNSSIILKTDFSDQIEVPISAPMPTLYDGLSTVVTVSLTIPKEAVELWWPNGMGKQPLYKIYVGTKNIHDKWIEKRIGFRTTSLVTMNENNTADFSKALHDSTEGSGQHGMYFRINGAIVMARGANFIPMDQLEGRLSSEAHKIAVQSASKANMNMMRVWGGGMVPLDSFYDTCDEEGILIYHDMMFVDQDGHRPSKTNTISKEIRNLVRSLASHPSLLVWNGCNECSVVMGTPSEIYATFVMKAVAEEDDTRPIWPSSPSRHGWKAGVRRLDGRPFARNRDLMTWDTNAFSTVLESHGPYLRSFSYSHPGVNGYDAHFPYSNTPPKLRKIDIGYSHPNEFASEFGSTTMSSFESMTGTITPMHWSLHGGSDPDECIHDYGNINRCNGTNIMAERVRTHILMFVLHVFSFSLIENDIIIASPCFHYFSMFLCLWKKELPV
jgi:beta-mannosidase